jgi:phosphomannomutase
MLVLDPLDPRFRGGDVILDFAMPHQFDPTILREYDIRGIVGQTLFPADAHALGRVFAATAAAAGGNRVAVGYDGRLTSPELEAALVDGLTEGGGGVDVVRIGRGPTPMLYYAAATLGVDGGIMVTGSHNPPDHNGFKLVLQGKAFFGEAIQRLGRMALTLTPAPGPRGRVTEHSVFAEYVARLARDYDGAEGRGLSVAWDCGNGATGEVVQSLVKLLPGRHVLLNETIDGRFPAHHPDPTVAENLVQLQQAVAAGGCDLGIGFDGDGDRIGIVDARGRILWGDQIVPILADVKASQVLFDEIARAGGRPVMVQTGHSLIKARLAEEQAPLAGEMSGHIFFAERWYGFDDAVYVAVRLLGVLARAEESLAAMVDRLPPVFNTPELRLPCEEARKFAVIDEVKERLRRRGVTDVVDIDGVRVKTADGWWLLRASNTQAVVVARAEATSRDGLDRVKRQLAAELAPSGLALPE